MAWQSSFAEKKIASGPAAFRAYTNFCIANVCANVWWRGTDCERNVGTTGRELNTSKLSLVQYVTRDFTHYLWGQSWLISPICAVMAAIELYTPQGAEMVSGMMYEPYEPYELEQGVIMRLEHHLVGGYDTCASIIKSIIIIIIRARADPLWFNKPTAAAGAIHTRTVLPFHTARGLHSTVPLNALLNSPKACAEPHE